MDLPPLQPLELVVTKIAQPKKQKKETDLSEPWISMKSGVAIISITSVLMAIMTAIEAIPTKGWIEGILWSLLFGLLIWAIFFVIIFFNKLLKR